jgi:glyoxylase-like metal-dependent hydrolase (beta-lactamase superfamily II)
MPDFVRQIAPGVYWALGRGITSTNVYLVRSYPSWVLVDTGWRGNAAAITSQAEAVFGPHARPAGILLTHIHPGHAGSAAELARGACRSTCILTSFPWPGLTIRRST